MPICSFRLLGMRTTLLILLLATGVSAQVVPTTPTKFATRGLGGGMSSSGVGLSSPPKTEPMVRVVSYIALAEPRQWTSADGKAVIGKLIAFEELSVETTKSAAAAAQPEMPKLQGKPTVVSNGKVRLLVNNKPFETALDRLSPADQAFVEKIREAVAKADAVVSK
jgi:hypothetical protein